MVQGGALIQPGAGTAAAAVSQPAIASASTAGHTLVLGAENAGSAVQQRRLAAAKPALSGAAGSKKRRRPADPAGAPFPDGAPGDEASSSDEEGGAAPESTLGERVAALQVTDSPGGAADDAVEPADGTITADSLSVLLTQVDLSLAVFRYIPSSKSRVLRGPKLIADATVCLVPARRCGVKTRACSSAVSTSPTGASLRTP